MHDIKHSFYDGACIAADFSADIPVRLRRQVRKMMIDHPWTFEQKMLFRISRFHLLRLTLDEQGKISYFAQL
jgi:hypothetical protein